MHRNGFFLLLVILLALACGDEDSRPNPTVEPPAPINSLALIEADMSQPHEGYPSGLLGTEDWATQPRIGYGNKPPSGWSAMIPWGQVYADSAGNPASNTRFQIRKMQAWYISKQDGQWKPWVQTSAIEGANYAEDFQNDLNIPADIRLESDGGGVSSTVLPGYNFHFWSKDGRISIDGDDIDGVWVSIESRLIIDDPNGPDDRAEARLLFSAGADYWLNLSAEWDQWLTNGDIGIGRFRYLTEEWQAFNMHTLTAEQLQNNPPPFQ